MEIEKSGIYTEFLQEIHNRIREAQRQALQVANKQLVTLYWDLGKRIVEKQREEKWGDGVIKRLAIDLQNMFPGAKGFSERSLWKMRDFYVTYSINEKLPPLVAEIGWTHNISILEKCKDPLEREFYIRMTRKYRWSKNQLLQNIENQTYEKMMIGQTNFEATLPAALQDKASMVVKDEYIFDFLELGDNYTERQLENALMLKIEEFLREMGGMVAFVGRQYRIEVDDKEYFIDILLYHRKLKCLMAVELKIGEFEPEYVGKMQFYLATLDAQEKIFGENSAIGIILCKTKSRTIVEYALRESNKPIGVAAYTVTKKLPKELRDQLPTLEQIEKLIDEIE
jgi:predicted nuclease of restriction endonuclease-like (RecB) superfamily